MLENLSKREKIIVITGSILIIFYLYFSVFLNPIYKKIQVQNNNIRDIKNQLATIEELKGLNITNKEKLESFKTIITEGGREIPENERIPEIARNLESIAKESNVIISSLDFGTVTNTGSTDNINPSSNTTTAQSTNLNNKINTLPSNLIIYGNYTSVVNFIANIEDNTRLAQISSINISSEGSISSVLQASMVINYYYMEGTEDKPIYDFKDDNTGKNDLFN